MIDGIWWLVILIAVVVALWLLAKARGGKDDSANQGFAVDKSFTKLSVNKPSLSKKSMSKQTTSKEPAAKNITSLWAKLFPSDALQKTAALLKKYFPEYQVANKSKHLLISKQGKKVAIITVDKKIAVGQRRLGDIPVINYHRAPSRAQLVATLKQA